VVFKSRGKNVKISDWARIYSPEKLEIGDNVRIDDFVVLSCGGGMKIGSHVHIACYGIFFAGEGIELEDFTEFAVRTTVLSRSDDFSGESMISPQIPDKYKPRFKRGRVLIKRHSVLGVGCTIMPGVTLNEGVAVGAYSFVKNDCGPWGIYTGVPARRIMDRSQKMLEYEEEFLKEYYG
jgi:galactoside O-acetyltransferase